MLFDKKKYYNYATTREETAALKLVLTLVICIIISIAINHVFLKKDTIIMVAIGAIIGLILGYSKYSKEIIKAEEMKMKLDIYNEIIKEDIEKLK